VDLTNPARPKDTLLSEPAAKISVSSLSFSADGSTVVGGGDDSRIAAWDISHPTTAPAVYPTCTRPGGPVLSVAGSGSSIATGCESGYIYRWSVIAPGRLRGLGAPLASAVGMSYPNSAYGLAFDGGGGTLAAARDDGTVVLWDMRDPGGPRMDRAPLSRHQGAANTVVALPATGMLASGGADGVLIWDLSSTAQPWLENELVEPRAAPLETAMFAPDGQHLLTGSVWQTVPSYLDLWPLAGPAMAHGPSTAGGPVDSAAFATDGTRIATVDSRDGSVSIWGTTGGALSFRRKLAGRFSRRYDFVSALPRISISWRHSSMPRACDSIEM
jgi:WD40 repeat protein